MPHDTDATTRLGRQSGILAPVMPDRGQGPEPIMSEPTPRDQIAPMLTIEGERR
jgi:hypothetical protein